MPVLLATAMEQAVKAAQWTERRGQGSRLPVAIVHQKGQHMRNALVCMRLGDFEDHFLNQSREE